MRIVQISGKGRVGKTSLAHLIAKQGFELGFIPVILPFAKIIKDLAEEQGITKDGDSEKYREFCQELGASKRSEDPDYWVVRTYDLIQEYMIKEVENKLANKSCWEYLIIQDDVRYMNELALGRDLSAIQIFVSSGGRELGELDAEWRNHESELLGNSVENDTKGEYFELFDSVILNNADLKDLEEIVNTELEEWLDEKYLVIEEVDEVSNDDDY